jgi:hydrogenase maturation protein HypF
LEQKARKALKINVFGVVQGVGFRPFVYRLAGEYSLSGWVRNTSGSVEIEVEGEEAALNDFIAALKIEAPPVAVITSVTVEETFPEYRRRFDIFDIKESESIEGKYQLVSPDIATCPDCRDELFSPENRRYNYPFTNCTNCGPRFTIIEDIPYDRSRTTMRKFTMCPACGREYADPLDRRFHAEPNACPVCGPALGLYDNLAHRVKCADPIKKAAELIKQGEIIALKGLGGFQLACDAANSKAVKNLRARKHRPGKPFALMMADIDTVKKYCLISPVEERLMASPQAPVVLLRRRSEPSDIVPEVAPNLKYLGVMLPYTPLHHLLMRELSFPLIMTSGNMSEEPIVCENEEAIKKLGGIAGCFLAHNRDIAARYDDSVALVENDSVRLVRRARGYAPYPITLPFKMKNVLACGGEEKSTFCLTRDEYAFVSQHIGDMENAETLTHFGDTLSLYKRLFRIEPEIIAYDLHPEYLATKFAMNLKSQDAQHLKFVPVQHHHAHIASCMAENGVADGEKIIGVAFDGTGYGDDGNIWGGEFFTGGYRNFERVGHFEYVPMPGGAEAIRKPYRMALGYLISLFGKEVNLERLPLSRGLNRGELDIIKRQLERKLNSPLTSSAGRLFDAVAAIIGLRREISYEAQAAVELEMAAKDIIENGQFEPYPFRIENGEIKIIRLRELLLAVVRDVKDNTPVEVIAARFHVTIESIIIKMCWAIFRDTGLNTVALSGGVFQNRLLIRRVEPALIKEGFRVLVHKQVPTNDGGISLGQAVIANFAD